MKTPRMFPPNFSQQKNYQIFFTVAHSETKIINEEELQSKIISLEEENEALKEKNIKLEENVKKEKLRASRAEQKVNDLESTLDRLNAHQAHSVLQSDTNNTVNLVLSRQLEALTKALEDAEEQCLKLLTERNKSIKISENNNMYSYITVSEDFVQYIDSLSRGEKPLENIFEILETRLISQISEDKFNLNQIKLKCVISYLSTRLIMEQGRSLLQNDIEQSTQNIIKCLSDYMEKSYERECKYKRKIAKLEKKLQIFQTKLSQANQMPGRRVSRASLPFARARLSKVYTNSFMKKEMGQVSNLGQVVLPDMDMHKIEEEDLYKPKVEQCKVEKRAVDIFPNNPRLLFNLPKAETKNLESASFGRGFRRLQTLNLEKESKLQSVEIGWYKTLAENFQSAFSKLRVQNQFLTKQLLEQQSVSDHLLRNTVKDFSKLLAEREKEQM